MSKLNLSVFVNAYSDHHNSNAPSRNNVRWARDLLCCPVENPTSQSFTIAPGQTSLLFSGSRTLAQDSTTQYSISLVPFTQNTYTLVAVGGTLPNFRTPRTTGADATTQVTVTINGPVVTFTAPTIVAVAASFTGMVAGMTSNVTITAITAGTAGNSVLLTGDGTSTLSTLISTWNTDNPSNTITLTAGDGTQIPALGATIHLSGGINSATAFNLVSGGAVVGDNVSVGMNFNVQNQGTFQIIAVTATSFSVNNDLGVAEGPILLGSGFTTQVQIFSAAGVQVNDTLVISGGFSPVTQGSYKVTAVFANSLQFYSTSVLPQEGPIMTEAINIYSAAKNFIYMESDNNLNVILNGTTIGDIEPFIVNGFTHPGVFMLKSTVYSLSVSNTSVNPANMLLIAVE